jgi:hypothetical protein
MRLSTSLIGEICQRIKAGAFEQVAVESLGVPFAAFRGWVRRGQRRRASGLCRQLVDEVRQARGHARLMAEMQLRQEDAKAWLLHGPGRDTAAQDGWGGISAASRAHKPADGNGQPDHVLVLGSVMLQALTPFPEARAALAEVLARLQPHDQG